MPTAFLLSVNALSCRSHLSMISISMNSSRIRAVLFVLYDAQPICPDSIKEDEEVS